MDPRAPLALLGGLTPETFMRRHWQRKPLLVRQALPGLGSPAAFDELRTLAAREDVESRLVRCRDGRWSLRRGPMPARALPARRQPGWTLLVQGLDLHVPAAHELLQRFRFIPQARLDDLMLSYATDGGGVGPHLDSYDVFLIQVHGQRRWRIGRPAAEDFVEGLPLKILRDFQPEAEWVLEPGDLLYLPPRWAHDGQAVGECMTCSVGFRSPTEDEVAAEVLARLADEEGDGRSRRYRDPGEPATQTPGRIPDRLAGFAREAVRRRLADDAAIDRALGEFLTEPKAQTWFEACAQGWGGGAVRPHSRSRLMYDEGHVYLNGESFHASGRDARLMRRLADEGHLSASDLALLSPPARQLMSQWVEDGWMQEDDHGR